MKAWPTIRWRRVAQATALVLAFIAAAGAAAISLDLHKVEYFGKDTGFIARRSGKNLRLAVARQQNAWLKVRFEPSILRADLVGEPLAIRRWRDSTGEWIVISKPAAAKIPQYFVWPTSVDLRLSTTAPVPEMEWVIVTADGTDSPQQRSRRRWYSVILLLLGGFGGIATYLLREDKQPQARSATAEQFVKDIIDAIEVGTNAENDQVRAFLRKLVIERSVDEAFAIAERREYPDELYVLAHNALRDRLATITSDLSLRYSTRLLSADVLYRYALTFAGETDDDVIEAEVIDERIPTPEEPR